MRRFPGSVLVCLGLAAAAVAVAKPPTSKHPQGAPFEALQAEIEALRAEIEQLRNENQQAVEPMLLVDSEGRVLGPSIEFDFFRPLFLLRLNGRAVAVGADRDGIVSSTSLSFPTSDCSGPVYISAGLPGSLVAQLASAFQSTTGEVFAVIPGAEAAEIRACSVLEDDGSCRPAVPIPPIGCARGTSIVTPAESIGTVHYTPPLHLE